MKIMSFNTQHCMNYITRKIDFQKMADAIKACDADLVGNSSDNWVLAKKETVKQWR